MHNHPLVEAAPPAQMLASTLDEKNRFVRPETPLAGRWKLLLCLYFLGCVAWFAMKTAHWEQVNDPAQLHYACFLMDHGMAPYRDILEINMPGTYLVNWSVMHSMGGGSVAWRLFDFGLMGVAAWAMIAIAWPYDWLAGALGASLFILYHGKDGAGQEGQRDLIIAVLLLCAYAFLFQVFRKRRLWTMFAFGLCAGIAVTIKPLPLPLFLILLAVAAVRWKRAGETMLQPLLLALIGFSLPIAGVALFLFSQHALGSFWYVLRVELPYYQSLGRLPFRKALALLASDAVKTLALIAVVIAAIKKSLWNWESKLLVLGILFGIVSFLGQGKGFPYHRYPMLAFLFLWIGLEIVLFLRSPGIAGMLAKTGLCFCLVLLPVCVHMASRKVWAPQYMNALTGDLERLGGPQLSGHVQCLDVPADCDATLYRMRLVQSTGLFYDYLIFGPAQQPVIRHARARFWQQFERNPPAVLIVGKGLFPADGGYEKLTYWPALQQAIDTHYVLYDDRTFPKAEAGPRAFRIYVQKKLMATAVEGQKEKALP